MTNWWNVEICPKSCASRVVKAVESQRHVRGLCEFEGLTGRYSPLSLTANRSVSLGIVEVPSNMLTAHFELVGCFLVSLDAQRQRGSFSIRTGGVGTIGLWPSILVVHNLSAWWRNRSS